MPRLPPHRSKHCKNFMPPWHSTIRAGSNPAHVTTLVRRATGRPVQAWIIAGRLAEATRRLRHTDEIVDVIAERVGYADATHFIRLFRREHGITPAAWRSRQRSAG